MGIVQDFKGDALPIKLVELGCLPGNEVRLLQVAPLRDPICIDLNGMPIAIRRAMARKIAVEIIDQGAV